MLVKSTALLGTVLAAVLPGAARQQQRQPTPGKTPPPAQAATAPTHPRNYLALLPPVPLNRATIVIDPSHGGTDNGSRINDSIVEKDVTLSLALRLRTLLNARGFNVVLTRNSDDANESTPPFVPLTLDDRAGIANHASASACLLLHATASGTGVHLYTSELTPAQGVPVAEPWLTAQSPWVAQSRKLATRIGEALTRSRVALIDGSASVRPLDSLTCPALVIELAPDEDDPNSINDVSYQQRVAQAITGALATWKTAAQPPNRIAPEPPSTPARSEP